MGKLAPDFRFQEPDGQTASLSDLRGRAVMLNFWATWCGPCRAEMGFIQEISEDQQWVSRGLLLLTVNDGESADKVEKFMKDFGFSFSVLLDTKMSIVRAYNVRGIPTTFLIDSQGIIRDIKVGSFLSKAEIEQRLNRIVE